MVQYDNINATYRGIDGIVRYVNDQSDGIMMPFFLLAVWVIILVSQLNNGFPRAFLVSSFVISILAIFLAIFSMLAPTYMYVSFVFVGLGILFLRLSTGS